ncbi:MAG: hypothetical protein AAF235_10350 [Planctomycetota bacterium]
MILATATTTHVLAARPTLGVRADASVIQPAASPGASLISDALAHLHASPWSETITAIEKGTERPLGRARITASRAGVFVEFPALSIAVPEPGVALLRNPMRAGRVFEIRTNAGSIGETLRAVAPPILAPSLDAIGQQGFRVTPLVGSFTGADRITSVGLTSGTAAPLSRTLSRTLSRPSSGPPSGPVPTPDQPSQAPDGDSSRGEPAPRQHQVVLTDAEGCTAVLVFTGDDPPRCTSWASPDADVRLVIEARVPDPALSRWFEVAPHEQRVTAASDLYDSVGSFTEGEGLPALSLAEAGPEGLSGKPWQPASAVKSAGAHRESAVYVVLGFIPIHAPGTEGDGSPRARADIDAFEQSTALLKRSAGADAVGAGQQPPTILAAPVLVASDDPRSLAAARDLAAEIIGPLDAATVLWSPSLRVLHSDEGEVPEHPVLVLLDSNSRIVRAVLAVSPTAAAETFATAIETLRRRRGFGHNRAED